MESKETTPNRKKKSPQADTQPVLVPLIKVGKQLQFKTPEENRRYIYNLIFIHILSCLISVMISDFPFL